MNKKNNDKLMTVFNKILNKFNIKLAEDKINLLIQIFKFAIVGGISTIIDWVVYYLLYNKFNIDPLIANIISFAVSVIYNYTMSVKWVFNVDKNKSKKTVFIEFIVFSVIGLLISEGLLYIFINKLSLSKMLSKIIATIIVMIFNFITRKLILEKKEGK